MQESYSVGSYYDAIDGFAPFSLAFDWDNPGLLIGSREQETERALVALDATLPVIREARELGATLLITHHPIIFPTIRGVPADSPVFCAIQAGISVICAHTNLDIARGGVNDALADALGLSGVGLLDVANSRPYCKLVVFVPVDSLEALYSALVRAGAGRQGNYDSAGFVSRGEGRFVPMSGARPSVGVVGKSERVEEARLEMLVEPESLGDVIEALKRVHPYEEPAYDILETHAFHHREGIGRVGTLPSAMKPQAFAAYVKERLGVGGLRFVPGEEPVKRVAVCGGSGANYLHQAKAAGAQALVSAEAKHHQLIDCLHAGLTLVDAGHHATEAVVLPALRDRLLAALPGADIRLSQSGADPVRYL